MRVVYNMFISVVLGVVLAAMVSCGAAVKMCKQPELDLPEEIVAGEIDSLSIADVEWWEFYGDEVLKGFIEHALENNKDVNIAAAKVEQLRALNRMDRAAWFPKIGASAMIDNEVENYTDSGHKTIPQIDLKLDLSWEIDLWGSIRWANERSKADYMASVEAERAMRMTIIAEVATAYYELLALENELLIVNRTLQTRMEGVEQARLRYEGGLTSETVYQQAQVEYASTAALIPAIETKIAVTKSALKALMGEYPDFEMEYSRMKILDRDVPVALPLGLPSELLTRRPDLRESEQRLKAASAAVGVAYTDRFPKLTLGVTGGWENGSFTNFFSAPYSLVVGKLAAPLFEFGRRKAKYQAAIHAYDVARLDYEERVLMAFKECSDAYVRYCNARRTTQLKNELREAALKYVELATFQYRYGGTKYIDVLDAQRRYFDAQIGQSNAVRDEYIALVRLYKSLGGGWEY
jgi:multidrug efflux system outer membrane protein